MALFMHTLNNKKIEGPPHNDNPYDGNVQEAYGGKTR